MQFFKAGLRACFFMVVIFWVTVVQAQPLAYGLAAPGYSGLGLTPSAAPIDWGAMSLSYGTANPGANMLGSGLASGHNINLAIGVLPGVEIDGRLATNNLQCNLYGLGSVCPPGSYRDLSANFKLGHTLEVGQNTWVSAAAGTTDYGGAATNFRSFYAAVSVRQPWWALTLGSGKAVSAAAPLAGFFGHAAIQVLDPLQVYYERIGSRQWLGARYEHPLWGDERVQGFVTAQRALQTDGFTPKQWLSFGVKFNFDAPQISERRQADRAGTHLSSLPIPISQPMVLADRVPVVPPLEPPRVPQLNTPQKFILAVNGDVAQKISGALAQAGFESISIGEDTEGPIVQLENYAYNWNQLDALGVAMGLLSEQAAGWPSVRLQILRRGMPIYLAQASPACMARWLAQYACDDLELLDLRAGQHAKLDTDQVQWWVRQERASLGRTKFFVTPAIDSRVGTEYGTLDSTWGLNFTWQTPLWRGANTDIAYVKALGHSQDYAPGGIFSDFRIDSLLHRVMLHQAMDLPWGLSARVAAGRLVQVLDGYQTELRWESPGGHHRFTFERAQFDHRYVNFQKVFNMTTYRHYLEPINSTLELKAGQWWHGDRGQMAILRHWFGDTSVALYARRSRFAEGAPALFSPYGSVPVMSAGFEVSFPLTPRREVQAEWLQPRGDDRFSYGLQSVVGAKNNTNYITPYFGNFSPVPLSLDGSVYNFDRGSQAYMASHLQRIRQAWQYFVKKKDAVQVP